MSVHGWLLLALGLALIRSTAACNCSLHVDNRRPTATHDTAARLRNCLLSNASETETAIFIRPIDYNSRRFRRFQHLSNTTPYIVLLVAMHIHNSAQTCARTRAAVCAFDSLQSRTDKPKYPTRCLTAYEALWYSYIPDFDRD